MSKFKKSAGGFGDDFVLSQVEMHRHNYRKHGYRRDLIKILEVIEPFLEKDISQEINTHLDTFADDIINEEAEKSFRQVLALLDEAAAIKVRKPNILLGYQ